jgi:deoxyribodipyrimidine photo-lyase
MTAYRRLGWNFALERAVEWARHVGRPLVVLELLLCDYPWASDRLHRFLLDGMRENARRLATGPVLHHPYVEPKPGDHRGLLEELGRHACVVVSDDFPAFVLPRWIGETARRLPVRLEVVDSNGLLPLRAADRTFSTAHAFRRFLQKGLPHHLTGMPRAAPLRGARLALARPLPATILRRWPAARRELLGGGRDALAGLPIDHGVGPAEARGGERAALRVLRRFLESRLPRYAAERNQPQAEVTSGLSPYLHFGNVSAHRVFAELMEAEGWRPESLGARATGSRTGWWGVGENAEAFLDQLVTWRELGFNMCARRGGYARYGSLPAWARKTLEEHERDPRSRLYTKRELEAGATHDPLWNAAQMELVRHGRIHNYLRMLWGKKILEWSPSPRRALRVMIELNDRYALDGRDPNSYSGIFWCLGRYDRAWGPERPVFGKVRYMSSENTARKVRVREYLQEHAP